MHWLFVTQIAAQGQLNNNNAVAKDKNINNEGVIVEQDIGVDFSWPIIERP